MSARRRATTVATITLAVSSWAHAMGQNEPKDFRLAPSHFLQHYSVGAANGDSTAVSLEQIAEVNRKLAGAGDRKAAFQLGLAYLQGYGVEQDATKAAHWLTEGAIGPDEQRMLASMYRDGDYLPQSAKMAEFWYRKAGGSGDLFEIAQMYREAQPSQIARAAPIYLELLHRMGAPEVRRAQLELGNFVLDSSFSAGDDAEGRALNLLWARSIAQELLGQAEYNIALDFEFGREGVATDHAMWARYCQRAAAYNIDLAQEFFGKAMLDGQIADGTATEGYVWIRLSSDKRYENRRLVRSIAEGMSDEDKQSAELILQALNRAREQDGAFYRPADPLLEASTASLSAMQERDPDVELRQAFRLEQEHSSESYKRALALYRDVRDNSHRAAMAALGQSYLRGVNGVPQSPEQARLWLRRAAGEGYEPATKLLIHE